MKQAVVDGEDLLIKIQQGSSEAFEQFYDQYARFVFAIAFKILKNKADAEDLCHDVFIEIHKNPFSYDSKRGSVEAWLAIKTKSRCLDRLRGKKYSIIYGEDHLFQALPDHEIVEEKVLSKIDRDLILKGLNQLPESQRDAVYGNYFKDHSHRELSEAMDRPLGTIKSLVRYGIKNLRNYLEQVSSAKPSRGEKQSEM